MAEFYVSMTGFRPSGLLSLPAFVWRTLTSLSQAQHAPGNLGVTARIMNGTYHTMTIWMDENVAELVQPSLIKKWRHCPASAVQKKICSFNGRSSP